MKNLRFRLFEIITIILAIKCILSTCICVYATNDESLMYKNSDFLCII